MNLRALALYTCFVISGASALMYEIAWQRSLTLVFGLSTMSVAAVFCAFLAGLALGARLLGGVIDRSRNVLRAYGLIEVGIALAGVASSLIVPPLMGLFTSIHRATEPEWFLSNLLRFALSLLAFGLPSVLIGATVPAMARLVAMWTHSLGQGFGRFYAVNTAGSVLGAAAAGFLLIPRFGVTASLYTAAAGNILVAATALLLSLRSQPVDAVAPAAAAEPPPAASMQFVLWAALLSGAMTLAYEIAWLRLMAVYTLNSVYVFTMVVTVFLAALAIGSGLAARVQRRGGWSPAHWVTAVQLAVALLSPLTLALVPAAAELRLDLPGRSESSIFLREYALAGLLVFVPTVLLGMTLPLLVGMCGASSSRTGATVGRVYAWNSVGTILGSALTGAVMVPLVGLRGTLLALSACGLLLATMAACTAGAPRLRSAPAFAACGVVLLVALVPGATRFFRPSYNAEERVLYYAEGPSAVVHITEVLDQGPAHRRLYVDSEAVAGSYPEIVLDQKMLAHIPLLLHPDPKRVLTVGFGTGGTSYSMLQHAVRVDCVEIEPKVPAAYKLFLSENQGMVGPGMDRPNFRLVLEDARAWLHVAPQPYDVIVTDVTSIQYRGNGNLYTVEYFELMKRDLAPGGLGCAWVPVTGVTPEQLRILVRSFAAAYEHVGIWYVLNMATDFVILVGGDAPTTIPLDRMTTGMNRPLVASDLARVGITHPMHLAVSLLLADDDVRRYAGDGPLHTDDRPVLDYLTHAGRYQPTLHENLRDLLSHRTDPCTLLTGGDADACATWSRAAGEVLQGHMLSQSPSPADRAAADVHYAEAGRLLPDYNLLWQPHSEHIGERE